MNKEETDIDIETRGVNAYANDNLQFSYRIIALWHSAGSDC